MIPMDVESLLDLGCGRGIVGALCRIYRAPRRLVGLDAGEPYLSFCWEHRLYDELVRWDLNELPPPFGDEEFDVVTVVEVIEHLPRAQRALCSTWELSSATRRSTTRGAALSWWPSSRCRATLSSCSGTSS
jgi:2-polyprenyl-3-methyl-5-hydroxy-6-metoxy-1,4-benzoquinol methylase